MNDMNARYVVLKWLDGTNRTQNSFAAELGMQSSSLSMIMTGQRRMSLEDALKASTISGLPVDVFHRLWAERREQGQEQVA